MRHSRRSRSVNASLTNLQTADTNILSTLSAKLDVTTHTTSASNLQTQMTTNQAFAAARFSVLDGGHADPASSPERGRVGLLEDRVAVVEAADTTAAVTQLQTDLDAAEVLIGQVSNTTNSKQPTLLRPLFPTTAVELIYDSSQVKWLLGSGGIEIAAAQHQEGGFSTAYANVALDNTHQGLPARLDVLELQDTIQASTKTILLNLILNLDTRLDVIDGGTAGGLILETGIEGPLSAGLSNNAYQAYTTPFGTLNTTIHNITFTRTFTSPPRMYVGQSGANSGGHHTLMRIFVGAVTTSGAEILISETHGSNHVYVEWAAIQQ